MGDQLRFYSALPHTAIPIPSILVSRIPLSLQIFLTSALISLHVYNIHGCVWYEYILYVYTVDDITPFFLVTLNTIY